MQNCKKKLQQIFSRSFGSNICPFICQNVNGWSNKSEIWRADQSYFTKKTRKLLFLWGQPFLRQISSKHLKRQDHQRNIWGRFWRDKFDWSQHLIHILPRACWNWNWFYCKFDYASEVLIKVLKTVLKLKIAQKSTHKSTQTSQELRMLSSVTINCQITKIVMNSGSQLLEL